MKHNWRYEVRIGDTPLASGNTIGLGDALQAVANAVGVDPFREHYDESESAAHPGYVCIIAPLVVSISDPALN